MEKIHPKNNLRLLRIWRGMLQIDLADQVSCSRTTIADCENGNRMISLALKKKVAGALNVPERMIDEPITIILKDWGKLVSDPRMPVIVDYILTWDTKRLSRLVHQIAEETTQNYAL